MMKYKDGVAKKNWTRVIEFLFPACLFTRNYVSLFLAFYGCFLFKNESQRIAVSAIFSAVIAVMVGIKFLAVLKKINVYDIIKLFIPLLIFLFPFFYGLLLHGIRKEIIWQLLQFILFAIPVFFVAVYIVKENKLKQLLLDLNWYGIGILPFGVFYILRFFTTSKVNTSYNEFGGLSYMTISYIFLIVFVVSVLNVIYIKKKFSKILQMFIIIVSWFTALYAGTRGGIVSFFSFIVIIFVSDFCLNHHRNIKPILALGLFMILTYVFSVKVWAPASSGPGRRLQNFLYDVRIYEQDSSKKLSGKKSGLKSEEIDIQAFYIQYCIQKDQNIEKSIKQLHENRDEKGKQLIFYETEEMEQEGKNYNFEIRRPALYKFAFEEFKKHPIIGNGAYYFQNKYDLNTGDIGYSFYPHNTVLELLCDFGLVGLVIFSAISLYLLVRLFVMSKQNKYLFCIVLFCISQIIKYMFSGGLYLSYHIFFSICFGVAYICLRKNDDQVMINA